MEITKRGENGNVQPSVCEEIIGSQARSILHTNIVVHGCSYLYSVLSSELLNENKILLLFFF